MAITRIGQWSSQGSSTTISVAISTPQYGDMLVAIVCTLNTAPNTPAGWTSIGNTGNPYIYVFYAAAAGNETSFSTTLSASAKWGVSLVNYRGANAPAGFLSASGGSGSAAIVGPDPPAVAAGVFTLSVAHSPTTMTGATTVSGASWAKIVETITGGETMCVAESTSTDPPACTFTFSATSLVKTAAAFSLTVAPVIGQAQTSFFTEA